MVALFGATALGKTDVAIELAERLGADIVVADSMQVYAGLPIVTNQPDAAQRAARAGTTSSAGPRRSDEFTVAEYAAMAHEVIDGLLAGRPAGDRGGRLRAVPARRPRRPRLRRRRRTRRCGARSRSAGRATRRPCVAELRRLDPGRGGARRPANPRRVLRALESPRRATGAGAGQRDELWRAGGRYAHRLVALDPGDDREALKARIERRVDEMLAAGALEEVAAARAAGPLSRTAAQAIGVRELCAVLDGELALPEAAARMKARTRALARRQLTWMRKLPAAARVPADGRSPDAVARDVLELVRGALVVGCWFRRGASRRALFALRGS